MPPDRSPVQPVTDKDSGSFTEAALGIRASAHQRDQSGRCEHKLPAHRQHRHAAFGPLNAKNQGLYEPSHGSSPEICSEGTTRVGTREMGDAVVKALRQA